MVRTLPHPSTLNSLNHIPPPSPEAFDAEFGGLLPKGKSIPSSWGVTRLYDFNPPPSPTARKVLLIHGGGTPAWGMVALANLLTKAGNHVVTYDLYGHGNSSTPLTTHTAALMHAQVFEVLSYIGWSKAHFIGFSMGGAIVATLAATHPHLVESAALVAGAGLLLKSSSWFENFKMNGGWGREWLAHRTVMELVEGNPPIKADWRERLAKGEFDTAPVKKWQRENHHGHQLSIVSLYRHGVVFGAQKSFKKLGESKIKVLVILGEKDDVVEAESTKEELMKLGWKGKIEVVGNADHEMVRSHAKEVMGLIDRFWEDL